MKTTKSILLLVLLMISAVACKYDDAELWDKVNSLDDRVTSIEGRLSQMNSDINAISVIVNALQDKVYVSSVEQNEDGYQITFTNGKKVTISNGKDGNSPYIGSDGNWWIGETNTGVKAAGKDGENGQNGITPNIGTDGNWWVGETNTGIPATGANGKDAPVISVEEFEGKYYWVQIIDNDKSWLTDKNGNKIPVTGADAVTPILKVNTEGNWVISYDRGIMFELLLDENNNPVKAVGKDGTNGTNGSDGIDGDSFFQSVKVENEILILILRDGTELRVPLENSEKNDILTVRGSVDINNIEGLTINTLLEEQQLNGNNFSINVMSNGIPQLVYITGNNDDIIMMSRGFSQNDLAEVNARSTALALATMHPLFVSQTEEEYHEITRIIESSSYFQPFLSEVEKSIEAKKEILSTDNTGLLIALNNILEDLSSNPQVRTRANITGINSDPFVTNTNGNIVTIRNKGLVPSYECQVYYGGREKWNTMIESRSSYGFLDGFTHTMEDINLGEPVSFTLFDEGEYYFYCDRTTQKAIDDFSRRLWADALTIVGIDGKGWIEFGANCIKDIAALLADPSTDITNVLATISNWSFQAGVTLKWKDAAKIIGKFNLIYNAIKGTGNEVARIIWGFTAPYTVDFCICSYDNAITSCTETEIEKISGDAQEGFPNQRLMLPLTVLVRTTADDGSGITHSSYQKIKFEVISGNGSVEEEIVSTDISTGTAHTYWVLGETGEQKVKAVAIDMITGVEISNPVYFTANLKEAADLTIRLDWNKLSGNTDIDLHVVDPFGEEIAFYHMQSASGGWLDRDDVIGPGPEHVYWQNAPVGEYTVKVHYYGSESHAVTTYRVTINFRGETYGPYTGSIAYHQEITIGTITVSDASPTRSSTKFNFVEKIEVQNNKIYQEKK